VDDFGGSRPIAGLQAHLDPAACKRPLGPNGALTPRPTPTLGTVGTVAGVESIEAQTAGGHDTRIALIEMGIYSSFLPVTTISLGSIGSIAQHSLDNSRTQMLPWFESHPLRQ
jgi:hypothetical protein